MASPCSIIYTNLTSNSSNNNGSCNSSMKNSLSSSCHQVSVDGRRQGCVKKHLGTTKAAVAIARKCMAQEFLALITEKARKEAELPPEIRNLLETSGRREKEEDSVASSLNPKLRYRLVIDEVQIFGLKIMRCIKGKLISSRKSYCAS